MINKIRADFLHSKLYIQHDNTVPPIITLYNDSMLHFVQSEILSASQLQKRLHYSLFLELACFYMVAPVSFDCSIIIPSVYTSAAVAVLFITTPKSAISIDLSPSYLADELHRPAEFELYYIILTYYTRWEQLQHKVEGRDRI